MSNISEQLVRPHAAHGQFRVSARRIGEIHAIRLHGEFDLGGAAATQDALDQAERSDATSIVLDLSGLSFMDSTGVRLVLAAEARSRAGSGRLMLRRGPATVHRVFEICGVDGLLSFID